MLGFDNQSGAHTYVVTLARPSEMPTGRANVVAAGRQRSEAFLSHLRRFVNQHNRNEELIELGQPTSFGIVSIVCNSGLAETIRKFPEVESVIPE